jgi:hypothetical protein
LTAKEDQKMCFSSKEEETRWEQTSSSFAFGGKQLVK